MIVSMPKKGNSTALDNQRGIAKTCSSAKLFNKVLLCCLKLIIDPQLSQCQGGFRAGLSVLCQTCFVLFAVLAHCLFMSCVALYAFLKLS